jgi:hypothetical protein
MSDRVYQSGVITTCCLRSHYPFVIASPPRRAKQSHILGSNVNNVLRNKKGAKITTYLKIIATVFAIFIATSVLAGEEPFKAVVYEDSEIPPFYISSKLAQFTYPETFYYGHCYYYFCNPVGPVDPKVCVPLGGNCFICSSKCQERFSSKTAPISPEVCCGKETRECPDVGNSRITKGNSGWYEWIIGLPKKPEGEINIEIECGILKPNARELFGQDAINLCAAETGEIIGYGLCERMPGSYLKPDALPKITAMAYPGSQNDFGPFNLTAYRNPGNHSLTKKPDGRLSGNSKPLQILDGNPGASIALKSCIEESIMVVLPKPGRVNALGQTEANLEAGDLIKVRMDVPLANTVDIYCSQYSVKIGGIGEPPWAPAGELPCLYDECCLDGCCINDECGQ